MASFIEYTSVMSPDIVAGVFPSKEFPVTIASGQNLVRGTAIGLKTDGGKGYKLNQGASDGTENMVGILGSDTDASAADSKSFIYVDGIFRYGSIIATSPVLLPAGIYNSGAIIIVEEA